MDNQYNGMQPMNAQTVQQATATTQSQYAGQPQQTTSCAGATQFIPQPVSYAVYPQPVVKPETEQTKNLKKHFNILAPACLIYACFYALCMYKNGSGITYPFFLGGSLWFYCFCMKKLGVSLKNGSVFYMISVLLLGLSTFLTADSKIIFMNKTGIWVLTISFLLRQFYQVHNWTFGRYIGYVITAVFGSLGEIIRPFTDWAAFRKNRVKKGKDIGLYVVIGLCFSIPLFFIVFLLLVSADKVFFQMTEGIFENINFNDIFGVIFTIVMMFFAAYWIMAYLCKRTFSEEAKVRKQTEAVLGIVVALPVTILYLVFSCIQIFCLFLGNVNLDGYTYAEYAREGFFQLLVVCIINLVLVLVGHAYFKENAVLKGILTVMSLCTYIMIASAAYRMILYIKNYYLTFLRIFVLWSLVVIFILLTGVIISIFKKQFPLFKYSMVVVTICYLGLSFSHPDYWIAKCNVANMGSSSSDFFDADAYEDYSYLTHLSADAAPAFAELFAEEGFTMKETMEGIEVVESSSDEAGESWEYISRYSSDYIINSNGYVYYSDVFGGYRSDEESWGYYYLKDVYREYKEMNFRSFNLSKYIAYKVFQ